MINLSKKIVGKPKMKCPLGRSVHGWKINIKIDLKVIGNEDVDFLKLPQDRVQWRDDVNTVINLRVSIKSGDFTE
jgi:hypothetical protein